ncbi:MAG: cyclopropane fatty acyl phospholipid synthase [Merismopedia sp. SIO2A8]|nr:cyclopropane fatty acyl phospholipid synthase [Symploca sp. SIO2B6]NET49090.1 cyclopropane fatty acyl phospholipid synthase [Merismopedia sp. SIO2A8]
MVAIWRSSSSNAFRDTIQHLLQQADIEINGDRPWDIQVHHERLFDRLLADGSLAAGEAYMDGWWDCAQLDEFFAKLLRCKLEDSFKHWTIVQIIQAKFLNFQSVYRAFRVGQHHYDLGNDLYEAMLDRNLVYSCGYWRQATTLESAQQEKLDLIARKLDLQPGMRVMDIGCGWGSTARYLAEQYGVCMVGITISEEQSHYARRLCEGLPVEIRLQDYREMGQSSTDKICHETYDRILSVGMFEHVGYKNYRTFFECVKHCLNDDGRFLLHTIGTNILTVRTDPWIERYIFPNSMVPCEQYVASAFNGLLVLEDWHNFGPDYDKTLMAWFQNFDQNWPKLKDKYGDRFYRMWSYYLLSCAGSFRARKNHVWQLLLTPRGILGGYETVR